MCIAATLSVGGRRHFEHGQCLPDVEAWTCLLAVHFL
jgi:hypothetical protein